MEKIKISSKIPMPAGKGGRRPRVDARAIEVGQSFIYPEGPKEFPYNQSAALSWCQRARRIVPGSSWAVRRTDEGYRVWRVK